MSKTTTPRTRDHEHVDQAHLDARAGTSIGDRPRCGRSPFVFARRRGRGTLTPTASQARPTTRTTTRSTRPERQPRRLRPPEPDPRARRGEACLAQQTRGTRDELAPSRRSAGPLPPTSSSRRGSSRAYFAVGVDAFAGTMCEIESVYERRRFGWQSIWITCRPAFTRWDTLRRFGSPGREQRDEQLSLGRLERDLAFLHAGRAQLDIEAPGSDAYDSVSLGRIKPVLSSSSRVTAGRRGRRARPRRPAAPPAASWRAA